MAHPPTHSPHGTPKSDCHWVRERLERYWGFDLPGLDFYRTEGHLGQCADCARVYRVVQQRLDAQADAERGAEAHIPADATPTNMTGCRYLDASGEQFQSNYLTEDEQDQLADEILATLGFYDAILVRETGSVAVAVYEPSERIGRHLNPRQGSWKRSLAIAASLLLMVALPVLAVVGAQKFYNMSDIAEGSTAAMMQDSPRSVLPWPASLDNPGVASPVEPLLDSAPNDNDSAIEPLLLDTLTEKAEVQLELAALLPDTEEEYEAWARKEYPHIMGLYDILTDVDEKDPRSKPLWDGVPVNIPPWGQRLYAEVPEDERPTGWRALLIYSGEVFKFDWPIDLGDAKCEPTLVALQRTAVVTGFALKYSGNIGDDLLRSPRADGRSDGMQHFAILPLEAGAVNWEIRMQDMPDSYAACLVGDVPLATSTLQYFARSSNLVQVPLLDGITQKATELLCGKLLDPTIPECDVRARLQLFDELLDNRKELIECITQSRHEQR